MSKDKALKLALEALSATETNCGSRAWEREMEAIALIKEALASPVQEACCYGGIAHDCHAGLGCRIVKKLTATPPAVQPTTEESSAVQSAPVQEQQPYAYANPDELSADSAFRWCEINEYTMPVYTTPPAAQRPWVELTDERVRQLCGSVPSMKAAVREAEAELKELNT